MRVVAMIAVYNEERFIAGSLEHLFEHGIDVYLIDNGSTDATAAIARRYQGRGLLEIEDVPRDGLFRLRSLLERKEQLAATIGADWFMHMDADEIRLPPRSGRSLPQAFAEVEAQGYNAVNFLEFVFLPTREAPDHDHPAFQRTMRWYYPFLPAPAHRVTAWKRQPAPVELAWSGGHQVRFPGLRLYPEPFPMRHYLFLSVPHAVRKYVEQRYDPLEVQAGWHRARARLRADMIRLPPQAELRLYRPGEALDPSHPRARHYLFDEEWAARQGQATSGNE